MPQIPCLYVFTCSRFSEKARWACDRKRLGYQLVPLLPGLHVSRADLTLAALAAALIRPPGHPAQRGRGRALNASP